jgi:hypothetical protein
MAREKPLDVAVVQAWQAAWNESDVFSDDAVLHLRSFILDSLCLVVVTLGVGREPRSLVFRRVKQVLPPDWEPTLELLRKSRHPLPDAQESISTASFGTSMCVLAPSTMFVSPVAPVASPVGQLWHQTGVKSGKAKMERVLRWDGADWVIAGHVSDRLDIMKQGKQRCDFQEALAYAYWHTNNVWDCEFIYTYDGSTWGNA